MDEVKIGIAKENAFHEPTVYYLWECPDYIENEVWGESIQLGGHTNDTKMFHFTWLAKLKEVCEKHNVKINLIQ